MIDQQTLIHTGNRAAAFADRDIADFPPYRNPGGQGHYRPSGGRNEAVSGCGSGSLHNMGPPQLNTPAHMVTATRPLGEHWDELPASTRRYYSDHPSVTHQLHGGGAPRPTPTSNEEALIKEKMRTFPDQHPSLGSVMNAVATGCPAIVHNQMDSSQWKSTYQATINESQPTLPKRKEGKRSAGSGMGEAVGGDDGEAHRL